MNLIFPQTTRRVLTETSAVFNSSSKKESFAPARFLTRLTDVARSNSFLWTEAGLKAGERYTRFNTPGLGFSRSLVLGTVAADIFSGYLTLQERTRWFPWLVGPKDWELQNERGANRLLDLASSLGGALIKAGQFASTRPDLLPPIYIKSLSTLQDKVQPRDWPEIERALTRELGRPPLEVFQKIEIRPVAAASLSQVHRAWLKDGRQVALKIQYPGVNKLVAADLGVLSRVAKAVSWIAPRLKLQVIVDFLEETLPLELDLSRELRAMEEIRTAFTGRDDVIIPRVYPEFSTKRLLVMEFVEGIKVNDRETLEASGINPSAVARLLNEVYAAQIFKSHLLHADPHPGNILVQPGPKLVLLDHGLTMQLSPEIVKAQADMVKALVEGDFDALKVAFKAAGLEIEEGSDMFTLLQVAGVIFGGGEGGNLVEVGTQLGASIGRVPSELLLIGRALGMLNGVTSQLDPDQDSLAIVAEQI